MKRYKFKLLEHQADLKIKIFGKTKPQLFTNALLAMIKNINPKIKTSIKTTKQTIEIESINLPFLLIDFLNEILYLIQINKKIYNIKTIKITKLSEKIKLKAELIGRVVFSFKTEIKAATYHSLKVYKTKNNTWEAIILFDI